MPSSEPMVMMPVPMLATTMPQALSALGSFGAGQGARADRSGRFLRLGLHLQPPLPVTVMKLGQKPLVQE